MKETISTIAARTGVSVSTVSRVLSSKYTGYRISEATASLVRSEAERCHYIPNQLARGLRAGRTNTIGLILPKVENPFFSTLAGTVTDILKNSGYHTILADSGESEEEERGAVKAFLARSADGIIVAPAGEDPSFLEGIAADIPIVLMDRYFPDTTLPYVSSDNEAGGSMAAELILSRGCRRILSIQGVPWSMSNKGRLKGFSDALAKVPGTIHEVRGDSFSVENGYRATMEAFGNGHAFDSVFAYSSTILLGTMRALRELHLKVPDDVAVISFDNNGFLDFMDPPITRVEQPLREMGRQAVETMLDQIKQKASGGAGQAGSLVLQKLLMPQLVVRSSC